MAIKKIATRKEALTIQEKIQSHILDMNKSLEKRGLTAQLMINFPTKKKVPILGRLGIWLVNKNKGIIDTRYTAENGIITSNKSKTTRRK